MRRMMTIRPSLGKGTATRRRSINMTRSPLCIHYVSIPPSSNSAAAAALLLRFPGGLQKRRTVHQYVRGSRWLLCVFSWLRALLNTTVIIVTIQPTFEELQKQQQQREQHDTRIQFDGEGRQNEGSNSGGRQQEGKKEKSLWHHLSRLWFFLPFFIVRKLLVTWTHEQYNENYTLGGFGKRLYFGNREQQAITEINEGPDYVMDGKKQPRAVTRKQTAEEIVPSASVSARALAVKTPLKRPIVQKLRSGISIVNGDFYFDNHCVQVCDMRPRSYGKNVAEDMKKPVLVLNFGTVERAFNLQRKLVEQTGTRVIAYSHGGLSTPDHPELKSTLAMLHNDGHPPHWNIFAPRFQKGTGDLDTDVKHFRKKNKHSRLNDYFSFSLWRNPVGALSEYRGIGWYCHSRLLSNMLKANNKKLSNKELMRNVLEANSVPKQWNKFSLAGPIGAMGVSPTVGAPPTSDYHSRELAALLEHLNIDEDVMFISDNFNWLSTLKSAKKNLDFVAGVVLLDPWLPANLKKQRNANKEQQQGTDDERFDPRKELAWLTPPKVGPPDISPHDILVESLHRDIVFQLGPSKRLSLGNIADAEDKKYSDQTLKGVWNQIAYSDPRVEYLHQQMCCLALEDYIVKAHLAKRATVAQTHRKEVAAHLGVPEVEKHWKYRNLLKARQSVEASAHEWMYRHYQSPNSDWLQTVEHTTGLLYLLRSSYSHSTLGKVPVSVLITRQSEEQTQMPEMSYEPLGPGPMSRRISHKTRDPSPRELAYRKALIKHSDTLARTWARVYPQGVYFVHRSRSLFDAPWNPELEDVTKHVKQLIEAYRRR